MSALVLVAGLAQLALALGSLAIPRVLGWRDELARVGPLTRRVFWVWAGYVWSSHVAFGLVSVLAPERLTDGTPLARAVAGFVAAWWGVRLALQFVLFDRKLAGESRWFAVAEGLFVVLFAALALVYAGVAAGEVTS